MKAFREAVALCLLVGLAVPVPATAQGGFWSRLFGSIADGTPPWAAEAPGGAGARYGLGLDTFFEHQESLRVTFNEQRIASGDSIEIVRTDPGLLNRKFDLRWDLAGAGVQPAVALPLPRTLGIYPTLVFQAAVADVGLDFHDRNRPGDSSSLDGRGPLFGSGLDLTRSLCRSCPWFAGASYFFQKIPELTVDRSPAFAPPGFDLLEDRVRLGRDVQAVSTRVGYGLPGSRMVSYAGVLHRWNDVTVDDRLRYRDGLGTETALSSRTRLESEVTLALAGVEAQLGPRLFGRLEASVGGGDRGGLFRVVYLAGRSLEAPERRPERPSRKEAARIAGRLQEIRTELAAALDGLGDAVPLDTLLALLDRFETEVLGTLPGPEHAALRDQVTYEFQQVRESLEQGSPAAPSPPRSYAVRAAFDPRRASRIEASETRTKEEAARAFKPVSDLLDRLWKLAEDKDFQVNLCIKTEPVQGALVEIRFLGDREVAGRIKSNGRLPLNRGRYGYRVVKNGYATLECPAAKGGSKDCGLDLLSRAQPLIHCTLSDPDADCVVEDEPPGRWDCKAP